MAQQPMMVQADTWLDGRVPPTAQVQGYTFVRHGRVIMIDPASPLVTRYGGIGNLAPLTLAQLSHPEIADHSQLGN